MIFEHYHWELTHLFSVSSLSYIIDQGASNKQCELIYLSFLLWRRWSCIFKLSTRHKNVSLSSNQEEVRKYTILSFEFMWKTLSASFN